MEDKLEVVQNLETLLKSTREFDDLKQLKFVDNDRGEFVEVYFKDRKYLDPDYIINVTCDSGIAIIRDVMRVLY